MPPHGPRYGLGMQARGRLRVVFGRFWCSFHGKAAPFPGPLPKSPVKQGTETARNDRFSLHRALARRIGGMEVRFMARLPNRVSRFPATRDRFPIAPLHLGGLLVLW